MFQFKFVGNQQKNLTQQAKINKRYKNRTVYVKTAGWKIMEQVFLEHISEHTKERKMTGNSHHGLMKDKS